MILFENSYIIYASFNAPASCFPFTSNVAEPQMIIADNALIPRHANTASPCMVPVMESAAICTRDTDGPEQTTPISVPAMITPPASGLGVPDQCFDADAGCFGGACDQRFL